MINIQPFSRFQSQSTVGVMVIIRDSHSRDPGSIPGRCTQNFFITFFVHFSGQNLITYVMLAVTYLSLFCCQRRSSNGLSDSKPNLWTVFKRRGIRYFFLAVVDVEANYLVHRAFHYTSLTSVQVLSIKFSVQIRKQRSQ